MAIENFVIIIGAAKSGTSSLANWLGARKDMAMSEFKEPRFLSDLKSRHWDGPHAEFFASSIPADEQEYLAQFQHKPDATWGIDGSSDYLWCQASIGRIQDLSRRYRVKLICILRDPVDRAVSQYRHTMREGVTETLAQALELERARIAQGWTPLYWHVRRSEICDDLTHYHDAFGDALLVVDFMELRDPAKVLTRVNQFLGVPDEPPEIEEKVHNRTVLPSNQLVKRIWASPTLRRLSKVLIPKSIRHRAYLMTHSADAQMVTSVEIRQLRALLRAEIRACVASPLIPTAHWKTAFGNDTMNAQQSAD
jgi:Sulfotransferase family